MTSRSIGTVVIVVLGALIVAALVPKQHDEHDGHDHGDAAATSAAPEPTERPQITDLRVGTGKVAEPGDIVIAEYIGYLPDGKKLDASRDRKTPFRFLLGSRTAMPGWDLGVEGMRVGGKRKLVIPPSLGYGARGSEDGKVPPNTTLTFEIEVTGVEKLDDEPLLDPLVTGKKPESKAEGRP